MSRRFSGQSAPRAAAPRPPTRCCAAPDGRPDDGACERQGRNLGHPPYAAECRICHPAPPWCRWCNVRCHPDRFRLSRHRRRRPAPPGPRRASPATVAASRARRGRRSPASLWLSTSVTGPESDVLFRHACALGLEGVVSKRRASGYRSGPSKAWRKVLCSDYVRPGE